MFRCIAMGRRHSSHAARALLACYQRDARIINLFPRTMVKGKKRRPDSANRAILKPKCFFLKLFCTSLGFAASLVEELADNQVYVKVIVYYVLGMVYCGAGEL